jgi:hypothetical protein
MNLSEIFKEALLEAKKKKPSAGLTKKQKSDVAKKAKAGEDIGKKGKGFEKLAKKAGGGEKGEKIAAAAMWKNTKRGNVNEAIDPDALSVTPILSTGTPRASQSDWNLTSSSRPTLTITRA